MNICVFCSSSDNLAPEYLESGYKIGQLMANAGHTLVFGGYTKGIMGAVATGVRDNGGNVISVIPAIFNGKRPNFETGAHVILTDTMSSRKNKMIELIDEFSTKVRMNEFLDRNPEEFKLLISPKTI